MVYHSFLFFDLREHDWLYMLTNGQKQSGKVAVDLFFILSGFVVLQSREHSSSPWSFLKKRALRIYPAFIASSILAIFICGWIGATNPNSYLASLPWPMIPYKMVTLGVPEIRGVYEHATYSKALNGSAWSIPYEVGCYLLLALMWAAKPLRTPLAIGVLFASSYAAVVVVHFLNPDAAPWPGLLASFSSGMLIYALRWRIHWAFALVSFACLILSSQTGVLGVVMPLCAPILILWIASLKAPFNLDEDMSYGAYIYACPIQQVVLHLFGKALNPITHTAATIVLLLPLSWLSWRYLERPIMQLKQRLPLRDNPPSAAPVTEKVDTRDAARVDGGCPVQSVV